MAISFNGIRRLVPRRRPDKRQAGAIIISDESGERRILLVTNKEKEKWIFPKGAVKKKETPEEAAEREAAEESGIRGRVVAHVGATEFEDDGETVRVDYFLLQCEEEKSMKEDRLKKWCSADQVVETLDIPELVELVRRALPEIMRFK